MCRSLMRAIGRHPGRKFRNEADECALDDCAEIGPELGAYLVGSISARDRARLVRHLQSCERCRDELAGLAALPGLLHRVSGELPPDIDEPDCGISLLCGARFARRGSPGRTQTA